MGTIDREVTPKTNQTRYVARYSYVTAMGERKHRKRRFRLKKDAEAWLAQQEADLSRGVYFEASREPFGAYIDRWAAALCEPKSTATLAHYRGIVRNRFATIRPVPLCDLTQGTMRALLAQWAREQLAPVTIKQAFMVLRLALKEAVDDRMLLHNPTDRVKPPPVESKRPRTWESPQVEAFLRAQIGTDDQLAWELLFGAALRIGELCALRWEDIDWERQALQVQRTWSKSEDGRLYIIKDTTKTKHGRRLIPLPPHVMTLLEHERQARPEHDGGWLFPWNEGRPLTPVAMRRHWDWALARTDLPKITPHGARHSGASAMIAAGVPPRVVQLILGHSHAAFTMQVYVHPGEDDLRGALETLSQLYRGEVSVAHAQASPKVVPMVKKTGT